MKKKLQVLAISDTHQDFDILYKIVEKEKGDIFIHAGDFTKHGREKDFIRFVDVLDRLNFKHKIVIAGNHEISLDDTYMDPHYQKKTLMKYPCSYPKEVLVKELKQRCIYLEHEYVEVEGLKIFGSPLSLFYSGSAFQYDPKYDNDIWTCIPEGLDILMTHCPPYQILDETASKKHGGSKGLREVVEKRKPKFHIFGHIHQARGNLKMNDTIFLNAAKNPFKFMI